MTVTSFAETRGRSVVCRTPCVERRMKTGSHHLLSTPVGNSYSGILGIQPSQSRSKTRTENSNDFVTHPLKAHAAFVTITVFSLITSQVNAEARITLERRDAGGRDRFVVEDVGAAAIPDAELSDALQVFVRGANRNAPALFGSCVREDNAIVFEPRFPLRAGLAYRAVYRRADTLLEKTFALPRPGPRPPAEVRVVYPTASRLPENQLKFYIHFTAPMSRGEAYSSVRLFKQGATRIEFPFLELEQELWDTTGTRFTLFFDPGRVKRGLKPREEMGPALETGHHYRLEIDQDWRDADGRPLRSSFVKVFSIHDPDYLQPSPNRWTVEPPRAGTRAPLRLVFDEPLDHAMLQRVLEVQTADGEAVRGEIRVDHGERRWNFRPEDAWQVGRYYVAVDSILEDLAGNSIAQPFEIDVFDKVAATVSRDQVIVPFEVVGQ